MIAAALVLAVIVGGGFYFVNQNSQKTDDTKMIQDNSLAPKENEEMTKEDESSMMEDDKMTGDKMSDSRYVEYTKAVLDSSSKNRRVLYFYANWCPTCRLADPDLKANVSKFPPDVTVIRVNYNDTDTDQEEKDLAEKYGITYQHTFVQIDSLGKVITRWNGGQAKELLVNIK